jgi:hypothetical protein
VPPKAAGPPDMRKTGIANETDDPKNFFVQALSLIFFARMAVFLFEICFSVFDSYTCCFFKAIRQPRLRFYSSTAQPLTGV